MNATIDARQLAPEQRHPTIFASFQALEVGESLELHSDHEPLPLQQQFQALWPGQFSWDTLEAGPAQWRVQITRRPAGKSCCGCCGG